MRIAKPLALALLMLPLGDVAFALQTRTVKPDGEVRIIASTAGVTRVSVKNDRIRRMVHDETQFETLNDEETGDIFLRYIGPQDKLTEEAGYLITETGHTVSYQIEPRASSDPETVVITLTGVPQEGSGPAKAEKFAFAGVSGGGADGDGGLVSSGDTFAGGLANFARSVIQKHCSKSANGRGSGAVATESAGGLRAKVMTASGGKSGRYIRPQDYWKNGVLAVWVETENLAAGQGTWIVVIEGKK